jgi:hypothetical protein
MPSRPPSRVFLIFADRNGILFEWNEEVDESPEGIVDLKDITLYPSLAAEHPGVALGQDQPLPSIKVELVPQGRAEDAAAHNANIQPLDIAGVWAAPPLVTTQRLWFGKIVS